MTAVTVNRSPVFYARLGGMLYLVIIVLGIFSELFVRDTLVVSGDAPATAAKIMGSEELWRFSIASGLVMLICAAVLAIILYYLLRPVNNYIALLAVLFNGVSIAIEGIVKLELIRVLYLLDTAAYLEAWPATQLYAEAYQSVLLHGAGYNISLIFFGFNCLCWGYLLYKSGYFPRWLGVLLIICWLCYLVNGFSWLLAPPFAAHLFPLILVPCFIAELSFCLWLLFRGPNIPEWERVRDV
jgi:hypothetical protein